MSIVEVDPSLGAHPFNGSVVGEQLMADPWIQQAIEILESRPPKDHDLSGEPAKPKPARRPKAKKLPVGAETLAT